MFGFGVSVAQEGQRRNISSGVLTLRHSYNISNRYRVKSSVEQRLPFIWGKVSLFDGNIQPRTDLRIGLQRRLNNYVSTTVGGIYRFIGGESEQGLYQQMGYVQQTLTRFKVAHRVRFDQTFSGHSIEHRYRYRFGLELPRSGFRTDPGESYFALLTEVLGKFKEGEYTQELRVGGQLGFLFKNTNKGELLLELRVDDPGVNSVNLYLLGLNYYFTK